MPLYLKSAAIPAKAGISAPQGAKLPAAPRPIPAKSKKKDRPIPAKAGISAAAKRREIVQLPPSAWRFLPSQEWDEKKSQKKLKTRIFYLVL
ncbi:MAG: hypothetical protein ACR2QC_04630 [Gammaproteobacteria bacterium]